MKQIVGQETKKFFGVIVFLILSLLSYANEKTFEIGISQFAEHPALDAVRKGFEDELKELGVKVNIDYKNSQGDTGTTGMIAQKFVADKKDLIFAIATPSAQAAKQATDDIPILFSAVTDPVSAQLVNSNEKVGGNITGTSDAAPIEKQLALFKELNPKVKKVAIIYNTSEANSEVQINTAKKVSKKLDIEIIPVGVNNINDIPQAVNSVIRKVDGFYTITDNIVASAINLISKAAIKNKKISPTYSVELIFIYNVFKNSNNYSLSSAVSVLKSSSVVLFELLFLDSEESVLSSSLSDFESEDFVLPPFALAAASFAELITISRPRFAALRIRSLSPELLIIS